MTTTDLDQQMEGRTQAVNQFVDRYLSQMNLPVSSSASEPIHELKKSMQYSATNGGKRFRPVLSLLVGELFNCPPERILPFAMAVEFIHTYSLIHDDLPCMDNDDIRRGKPTNHKIYGEDFALLAGDALLSEAFLVIVDSYADTPMLASSLTRLLSNAAGIRGMVGGQAIDLRAGHKKFTAEELEHLHLLKTGALIRVAVEGAAVIAQALPAQIEHLRKFGEGLGLAFQIADDVLDHGEKDQDARSFTGILGLEATRAYLNTVSEGAIGELRKVATDATLLEHLIGFNQSRRH